MTRITQTAEWLELRPVLVRALKLRPTARRKLIEALVKLEHVERLNLDG